MNSAYVKFSPIIKTKINTIIECGSRDCLDAIEMLSCYQPNIIYSFECNPESIDICKQNIVNYPKIKLIDKAVSNSTGIIDFYATDMEKSIDKNIGAASALIHAGGQKEFIQKKIQVPCITLDEFVTENSLVDVDLLCLDLQGYEKVALEGFVNNIHNVKYIISEVSFTNYYHGNVLFDEFQLFLKNLNFEMKAIEPYGCFLHREHFANALFTNTKR